MSLVSTAVTVYSFRYMCKYFVWDFGIYANFAQVDGECPSFEIATRWLGGLNLEDS